MRIEKAKIKLPLTAPKKKSTSKRVSAYSESYKGEYYNIEVSKLIPYKKQSRKIFDDASLQNLANTIRVHGIRQPLTILPSLDLEGRYEIISGERRWRAAQMLGLERVPCIILQDRKSAEEIALIENIQRKNLHPLEMMRGFQNLFNQGICRNHQELADKIGVARTVVVETLSLQKLPENTKKIILEKNIKTRKILRELLKLPENKHERYITSLTKELKQINEKREQIKKVNFFSIHLSSEKVIFSKGANINLNEEQKKEVKKYIEEIMLELE